MRCQRIGGRLYKFPLEELSIQHVRRESEFRDNLLIGLTFETGPTRQPIRILFFLKCAAAENVF